MRVSDFLFRGQADARWNLDTTLERVYPDALEAKRYYSAAWYALPEIEAHTGKLWEIPAPDDYDQWIDQQRMFGWEDVKALEYFVYLRHHGFPSPLLDWTQSPFIAAYFAMSSARVDVPRAGIYAYMEFAGGSKGRSSLRPGIRAIGHTVRTHRRHFLQQSEYTFCTKKVGSSWYYANHADAFGRLEHGPDQRQDLVWRFTIPTSERTPVLRQLDRFNLNAFSLFGSEEGLMETAAFRAFT